MYTTYTFTVGGWTHSLDLHQTGASHAQILYRYIPIPVCIYIYLYNYIICVRVLVRASVYERAISRGLS